ncbi:hypothetical protein WN51_08186 [Melipona quadrifasciata]|uniref:Uncharacterized protein n=1 Tax=Melipona quadrifasciata TaxID=166423 RepID=A0A0N0U359_9HYME|nr:hypothetical protein WN51_08186 [Melipona quadrifasciata]
MAVLFEQNLAKLMMEREDIITKLLNFDIFWLNYKKNDPIDSLQKRFNDTVPLIDAFEKIQFRIRNLTIGSIYETAYDQVNENFEYAYYNLIGSVRNHLKQLRFPELLEQRDRICVALRRFEAFWIFKTSYGEDIQIHALEERFIRSIRLLEEFKDVQTSIMNIVAGTPEETIYGQYDENFKKSRSLSELTRQIAPPTKNGHAPPPTESRKSYQSVNPSGSSSKLAAVSVQQISLFP